MRGAVRSGPVTTIAICQDERRGGGLFRHGATRPDRRPGSLRRPYEEARPDWALGPDGRSLFAAQGNLARYGWIEGP